MEVRVILKAKKDFGTTKVGETLILYNSVFDAMNGIAFHPIDRAQWALLAYDLFTGLKDKNGKNIYVGDIIEHNAGRGHVSFDSNAKMIFNDTKRGKQDLCYNYLYAEIIGNIYEHKNLLAVS